MSYQRIAFWRLAFDWPPIPSSFAATFGSLTSIGGAGMVGRGTLTFTTLFPQSSTSNPVPTAKVLQGGIVGAAYTETISAQGGTAPYTFAVTVGSLPDGMTLALDSVDGLWKITGTPTTAATSDFTIQATDANSAVGSTDFKIGVTAPVSAGAAAYGWVA